MMSFTQLTAGCYALADRCVSGITANVDTLRQSVEHSIGLVTALSPRLGYENATEVAKRALESGKSVREVVVSMGLMTDDELDAVLGDTAKLVNPND
jgi:aspartate ammonia-lyase